MPRLCRYSPLFALLAIEGLLNLQAAAQVVPDNTLGSESSRLTINGITIDDVAADLIQGGARRGGNLFHSFGRFSIGEGQHLYFGSPAGVERIFSRVTGNLRSDILGTLGVAGGADLFLLNPRGVIFGPNAQLDIAGSFVASTADRFAFADGSTFSAIAPEESLLTVNVPLGVQFNSRPQNQPLGNIDNRAALAVGPGQTLTLFGNQVSSGVQLGAAGGRAQLLGNQVELMDSPSSALSEGSGDTNLLVAAAGDITVVDMADDALLWPGGAGEIMLRADADTNGVGNVVMLDSADKLQTNGRNLMVSGVDLALGIIDTAPVQQDASSEIIDVDTAGPIPDANPFDPGIIGLPFTAVDQASGAQTTTAGSGTATLDSEGNIAAAGIEANATGAPGGRVTLTAAGSIRIGPAGISAGSSGRDSDGGQVQIEAEGGVRLLGNVTTAALSQDGSSGDGGNIAVSSGTGDVLIQGDLNAFSRTVFNDAGNGNSRSNGVSSGNGGAIRIASNAGAITITGDLDTSTSLNSDAIAGNSGNGGNIRITSGAGAIAINSDFNAEAISRTIGFFDAAAGDSGRGGAIRISSGTGDITVAGRPAPNSASFEDAPLPGRLASSSTALAFSGLFEPLESRAASGNSGDGGPITISSMSGNITIDSSLSSISRSVAAAESVSISRAESGDSGNGGNITIRSQTGDVDIINRGLRSSAFSTADASASTESAEFTAELTSGNSGNAGNIVITSGTGSILVDQSRLDATSYSTAGSVSGIVRVQPGTGRLTMGRSGNGGTIRIASASGDIVTNSDLRSFSFSNASVAGRGGNIRLLAPEGEIAGSGVQVAAFSVSTTGAVAEAGGTVRIVSDAISGLEILTLSSNGRSGNVTIQGSDTPLMVSNLRLITSGQVKIPDPFQSFEGASELGEPLRFDFEDFGQAGSTFIESDGNVVLSDVNIQADANGRRRAGGVAIETPGQLRLTNSQISSNANQAGNAGRTRIEAGQLTLDRSAIESSTRSRSTGRGGNIAVAAGETILRNGGRIAVDSNGTGQGGNIALTGDRLLLTGNSSVSATTLDSDGGDVTIGLDDLLFLARNSTISTEAGTAAAGGDGGDIAISTRFISARENSDIVANAFEGTGGSINIIASGGVFGIAPRDFLTSQSDITASAQNRANFGEITIQSPEIDPSQSTAELPSAFVAPEVVRSCREALAQSGSEFIISGRGGIPQGPGDTAAALLWQDMLPIAGEPAGSADQAQPGALEHQDLRFAEAQAGNPSAAPVEAQGWLKNQQGQIVLVAEDPQSASAAALLTCES